MARRSCSASRLTLWAFAAALVLKSMVPMLAAGAAALQGKAVAEICTVYGVDMSAFAARGTLSVAIDPAAAMADHHHGHEQMAAPAVADGEAPADGDAPAPGHRSAGHASDHCALGGMVAMAAGDAPAFAGRATHGAPGVPIPAVSAPAFDAAARWAALLEHGPPAFS